MDKQRIKTIIYNLRKERQFLETHLLNICKQMPVWITQQYTYCKKGNCKCTKGHPHGPFHYLFFKEGDKVIHRYLPKDKLPQIAQLANSYRTYNEKLARLNKINKQIDTLLREKQKSNLVSIPKWIKKKKG